MSALLIAAGAPIEKEARPSDLARWNIVDTDTPEIPRPAAMWWRPCGCCSMPAPTSRSATDAGDTALHAAAAANEPAVIELLVRARRQVNAKNKNGQTPLSLTLPRKSERGPGFRRLSRSRSALRKLGATQ